MTVAAAMVPPQRKMCLVILDVVHHGTSVTQELEVPAVMIVTLTPWELTLFLDNVQPKVLSVELINLSALNLDAYALKPTDQLSKTGITFIQKLFQINKNQKVQCLNLFSRGCILKNGGETLLLFRILLSHPSPKTIT